MQVVRGNDKMIINMATLCSKLEKKLGVAFSENYAMKHWMKYLDGFKGSKILMPSKLVYCVVCECTQVITTLR